MVPRAPPHPSALRKGCPPGTRAEPRKSQGPAGGRSPRAPQQDGLKLVLTGHLRWGCRCGKRPREGAAALEGRAGVERAVLGRRL